MTVNSETLLCLESTLYALSQLILPGSERLLYAKHWGHQVNDISFFFPFSFCLKSFNGFT